MFPGAFSELDFSTTCAVFKEMAECFGSGQVAGNGDMLGNTRLPFKPCYGEEQRKIPAWLVTLRIDLVYELINTEMLSWYNGRYDGWGNMGSF